ncbi:MAG TPA: hypothetical protein PLJ25_05545 [Methanothrix sp.]|nr:hypothetical protein [Methanothrix sp.]
MKWLKNIFGAGKAEGPVGVSLHEMEAWLGEREEQAAFAERMAAIYSRVEPLQKAFSQDIADLESADPDGSAPPKLLRAGMAARGELVKQLLSLEEKLCPPAKRDAESVYQHHWSVLKGLERTVTTFGRAQRYVAALFPKSIETINSDLGKISRLLVEMEELIGKNRKLQEESWYCRELAEGLKKGRAAGEELRRKVGEGQAELGRLKTNLSGLEGELSRLAESEKGRAIEQIKERLAEVEQDRSRNGEELAGLLSPLSKALARIAKQGSSDRLALQHKDVLSRLLADTSRVQDAEISGSLQELRVHLAALGLKDRKKEKTLDHIDLLIKERSLEKAKARQSALDGEISILEKQLEEGSREGKLLKEGIVQAKRELKSLEAALAQSEKDLASLEDRARADESELNERLARIANKPVKIELEG